MRHRNGYPWLLALSLLYCLPAPAATIYKSIDENGIVSYSDTRPTRAIVVETMVIDEPAPTQGDQAQQRLQDMRETTDRMVSDRMAREKQRAELRQIEAQINAQKAAQKRAEEDNNRDNDDNDIIYTGYYGFPARRPWWHPHHPRPEHPIVHPPLLPPAEERPPLIRPLPGNDYPASLIRKYYDPKVQAAFR